MWLLRHKATCTKFIDNTIVIKYFLKILLPYMFLWPFCLLLGTTEWTKKAHGFFNGQLKMKTQKRADTERNRNVQRQMMKDHT